MLEWLKTILGDAYTEDIEKKISDEIGKGFIARTDFNTVNEELKTAKATIKKQDGRLEALEKQGGDESALQAEIIRLQGENAAKDEAHEKELNSLKLGHAVEQALVTAGARNTTAAKALLTDFLSQAKISDNGEVEGLKEAVKGLSEADDTSFLFEASSPTQPKISGATPANPDKTVPGGKAAKDMTYEEICAYMADNPGAQLT